MFYCFFFFFSSRRRHTRFSRDWSSDVCSSDLVGIDDDQGAHAEPGELLDEVAAEAAAADHGDAAPAQAELIGGGDRRAIAPVAARQEVPAERRHLDLAEA